LPNKPQKIPKKDQSKIFLFYIGLYIFTVTCGLGIKILVFTEISKQNKKNSKTIFSYKKYKCT
jgi:hypothetical protein